MRKLFSILIVLPCFCFSFSDLAQENLKKAWEYRDADQIQEALDYLDALIKDNAVPNVDKVHYLNATYGFFIANHEWEKSQVVWTKLKKLCLSDPECYMEMWQSYEYSFVSECNLGCPNLY